MAEHKGIAEQAEVAWLAFLRKVPSINSLDASTVQVVRSAFTYAYIKGRRHVSDNVREALGDIDED